MQGWTCSSAVGWAWQHLDGFVSALTTCARRHALQLNDDKHRKLEQILDTTQVGMPWDSGRRAPS